MEIRQTSKEPGLAVVVLIAMVSGFCSRLSRFKGVSVRLRFPQLVNDAGVGRVIYICLVFALLPFPFLSSATRTRNCTVNSGGAFQLYLQMRA